MTDLHANLLDRSIEAAGRMPIDVAITVAGNLREARQRLEAGSTDEVEDLLGYAADLLADYEN